MKKLFSLIFISFLGISVFGQIVVNSDGNVGIGNSLPNLNYDLQTNKGCFDKIGIGISWSTNYPLYVNSSGESGTAIYAIGYVRSNGSILNSDQNIKKNITALDKSDLLEKIKKVQGWTYEFKDSTELVEMHNNGVFTFHADTVEVGTKARVYVPRFEKGKHYGLLAQNVQAEFPELVSMDSTTMMLGVNYNGFIPILLDVVKAQQEQIEDMESRLTALENGNNGNSNNKSGTTTDIETEDTDIATLYQNTPNPFTYQTEIGFYLPENINTANIYVFNMQGTLVKTYPLTQRGNGTLTINGGELQAGMYFYTLTTDGKEVDTKKMILTD